MSEIGNHIELILKTLLLSRKETCEAFLKIILGDENTLINSMDCKIITKESTEQSLAQCSDKDITLQESNSNTKFTNELLRLNISAKIDNIPQSIKMQYTSNDTYSDIIDFYQEMENITYFENNDDFQNTYIIYISNNDYYKLNYPIYTFTKRCNTMPDLELNDGIIKIFINLSATRMKYEELQNKFHFPKLIKFSDNAMTTQRDFSKIYTQKYFETLYDLIEVLNDKKDFSKSSNNNIKIIYNQYKEIKNMI